MRYSYPARLLNRALAMMLVATPLAVVSSAPSAHAMQPSVSCPAGTETVTYDPPVTVIPQLTRIQGVQDLGTCTSTDPTIHTGGRTYDFHAVRSCATLTDASAATFDMTWSNEQTSTLQMNFVNNNVGGQVISTGTGAVVGGEFTGDTVLMVITGPTAKALDCVLSGVDNRTGLVQLAVAPAP